MKFEFENSVIYQFPCLSDNYGFLLLCKKTNKVATIDTPDDKAINKELEKHNLKLDYILNTHHHFDHAGCNLALKEKWNATIIANKNDNHRINGIDKQINDNDSIKIGEIELKVIETKGHTLGHLIYYAEDEKFCFVGDTLFSLGCGRLFEGDEKMMLNSLAKIKSFPDDVMIFCAHEYSLTNCKFALSILEHDPDLLRKKNEIENLLNVNKPSVPVLLGDEKKLNPFLNAHTEKYQKATMSQNEHDCFKALRDARNNF